MDANDKHESEQPSLESSGMELDESSEAALRADDFDEIYNTLVDEQPELEEETHGHYTWLIENWDQLEEKVYSPIFTIGETNWRILLFPKGCNQGEYTSVFLEYLAPAKVAMIEQAEAEKKRFGSTKIDPENYVDETYALCAQFALILSNADDPTVLQLNTSHHRFRTEVKDWGFTRFIDLRKLTQPSAAYARPFLENNRICVSACIRVMQDPTGVLWHSFVNYNSKKETGFVGLKNQGATCYMNSLLQSLYFTNVFRRTVFTIPTQNDSPTDSVAYALQRCFYNLQHESEPVSTTELTQSFGWNSFDSFMQHDVQEFNRVLQDNLEKKMKGTPVDSALNDIFVGKIKSYIKCIDVDYESSRVEDFWDVQLNVKGMKNLEESFRDAIQVETLTGDNKYFAEGHGLQDAHKGMLFESFPDVLQLQLKRFDYDMMRDMMVKINDRHEFPLEIDLEPYLSVSADKSESHVYALHGVLVHGGDLHGGHYYALIKPTADSGWFKFDDDRVTRATLKEVLEDNFGGEAKVRHKNYIGNPFKRFMNAYMLVYFRKSRLEKILAPITDEDVPAHVSEGVKEERKRLEQKAREREQQHLYRRLFALSSDSFRANHGFDVVDFSDPAGLDEHKVVPTKIPKTATVHDLKVHLAELFERDPSRIRLWIMNTRQNRTVRPDILLEDESENVEKLREIHLHKQMDLRIYVEDIDTTNEDKSEVVSNEEESESEKEECLLFLKYFDREKQMISGISTCVVDRTAEISILNSKVKKLMDWPDDTRINFYEEVKKSMVEKLSPELSFETADIQDGDIICFEIADEDEDEDEDEDQDEDQEQETETEVAEEDEGNDTLDVSSKAISQHSCKNALEYYDFLSHRLTVTFLPKDYDETKSPDNLDGCFKKVISSQYTYAELAALAAKELNVRPEYLRFTTTNYPSGTPRAEIKYFPDLVLRSVLTSAAINNQYTTILYEVLEIPLSELELKTHMTIDFLSDGISKDERLQFYVNQDGTVEDILSYVAEKLLLDEKQAGLLCLYEVYNHRILKVHSNLDSISDLNEFSTKFVEILPEDYFTDSEGNMTIAVQHFHRDVARAHGIPFLFKIFKGENVASIKKRLQERTHLPSVLLAKARVAILQANTLSQPYYLEEDAEIPFDELDSSLHVLGLDYPGRSTYKTYGNEQAIHMK